MASVRNYRDLIAWQLADSFKTEVFTLVRASQAVSRDLPYRNQLLDSASAVSKDIAEGFLRRSPADFGRFLDYGLGSLVEAESRLEDGATLGYFLAEDCRSAHRFAKRCLVAMVRLKQSQHR